MAKNKVMTYLDDDDYNKLLKLCQLWKRSKADVLRLLVQDVKVNENMDGKLLRAGIDSSEK